MAQFHLRFDLPNNPPYDRPDWCWQAYGELVLPFIDTHHPTRFWFSQYEAPNIPKHILVRYESPAIFDAANLSIQPVEHHAFNIHDDLGVPRFFGANQRKNDSQLRGSMIFDFLHQASLLTLDQLSHKEHGYWCLEQSPDQDNNHYGYTLESVHHLFCNLSRVPTAVALIPAAIAQQHQTNPILSPLYAKIFGVYTLQTPVVRVEF